MNERLSERTGKQAGRQAEKGVAGGETVECTVPLGDLHLGLRVIITHTRTKADTLRVTRLWIRPSTALCNGKQSAHQKPQIVRLTLEADTSTPTLVARAQICTFLSVIPTEQK